MGKCTLSAEQLAAKLDELGFKNVTGTFEYPGGRVGQPNLVAHGKPLHWGSNNGVIGLTDHFGHVWITREKLVKLEELVWLHTDIIVEFESGLWVPHSNACDHERCSICREMFEKVTI